MRKSLATLPPTLDKTYDQILSAITEEDSDYAVRILQWLVFSGRPLTLEELAEVVAIDIARDPIFDREEVLEDPSETLEICSSLVTRATYTTPIYGMDEVSTRQVIVLAHYSVKEYLVSDRIERSLAKRYRFNNDSCHSMMAKACLGYLDQFQWVEPLEEETLEEFKLAQYSAEFWPSHVRKAGNQMSETTKAVMQLFEPKNIAYLNWIRIHDPDFPVRPSLTMTLRGLSPPLYYASQLGLTEAVRLLLEQGGDVNQRTGWRGDALRAASANGHMQTVKLLLDNGADINVPTSGGPCCSALQEALKGGYQEIAKLLLEYGADADPFRNYDSSPLYLASEMGYEQMTKLLLKHGADINKIGGSDGTALGVASGRSPNEAMVKLLLDHGADVNASCGKDESALSTAASFGHKHIVKLLVDNGAKARSPSKNDYYQTLRAASSEPGTFIAKGGDNNSALLRAVSAGNDKVVKLLLDQDADVKAKLSCSYASALYEASKNNHEEIVKLLLEQKPNVNKDGGYYGTALQVASGWGNERIVKLLLEYDADVNARGGDLYASALHAASHSGKMQIVRLLLDNGADVNPSYGYFGNAFHAAASAGRAEIMELLLEHGARVDAQDYGKALYKASEEGHKRTVELLLGHGADVNALAEHFGTALQAASSRGQYEMVKLLIDRGADVNAKSKNWGSALHAATRCGAKSSRQVVKLLIEHGADINLRVEGFGTVLASAYTYHTAKLLLESGADFKSLDYRDGSYLHRLASKGDNDQLRLIYSKLHGDPFLRDIYGRTQLQLAARSWYNDTLQYLLSVGSDPASTDVQGEGLLHYASSGGSLDVVNAVIDLGPVFKGGREHWSPLHWACRKGKADVVERLIAEGIPCHCVTTTQPEGIWSPASIAIFHGNEKMLEELSAATRSLLKAGTVTAQLASKTTAWCNGCTHVS